MTGAGRVQTRAEFDALFAYLSGVRQTVIAGYRAGTPLAQLQSGGAPAGQGARSHASLRAAQVESIYRTLRAVTTSFEGALTMGWMSPSASYCETFESCASSAFAPATRIGLNVAGGRIGARLELTLLGQGQFHRESALYDDVINHRSTIASALIVYRGFAAGPSLIVGDSKGLDRVKEGFAPFAGRHVIQERNRMFGVTIGTDVALNVGRRVRFAIPLRVTYKPRPDGGLHPGPFELHAGIRVAIPAAQRVW